ncbi:MAG: hypothetical protein ACI92I_000660 [Acidimicrobiales bacterium]|jgi:hypothetical protein
MKEKEMTLETTLPIWWFIAWRVFLVLFILQVSVEIITTAGLFNSFMADLIQWGVLIIAILIQVQFTKMAINRDYKNHGGNKFRLVAVEEQVQTSTPEVVQPQSESPA